MATLNTKWKRIESSDRLAALSAADLYQLAAYAIAYGCDSVGLLYPEQTHLTAGPCHILTIERPQAIRLTLSAIPLDGQQISDDLLS